MKMRPGTAKEWTPRIPGPSSVLSPEEARRLNKIRTSHAGDLEIGWLCDMADKLSRMRIEEFDFPAYAALENPIACQAFALRYDRLLDIRSRLDVGDGSAYTPLNFEASCDVCEVTLLVRPWVRVDPETPPDLFEEIRAWQLLMTVDGFTVIPWGTIETHLVGPDGLPLRRKPFFFTAAHRTADLFRALRLDDQLQAVADTCFGLFLPNGTKVQIQIRGPGDGSGRPFTLKHGLVAALYTTRPL